MQFQRELALQSWDTGRCELPWVRDLVRARQRVEHAVRTAPLVVADDDEARRLYVDARQAEVVARHAAALARVHDLEDLLGSALARGGRFNLTVLRKVSEPSAFEPGVAGVPLPPPVWADFAPEAPKGWRRLLDGHEHHELRLADARDRFRRALREHRDAEIERSCALVRAQRSHDEQDAVRDAEAKAYNEALDVFAGVLNDGDPAAVTRYFGLVLSGSVYPVDFPQHFRLVYLPQLNELVVEVTLPGVQVIPTVSKLRYVLDSDEVVVRPRDLAQVESLYASVVAQVVLRTLHELFDADSLGWLETVTLNGMITGAGTGRPGCLVTVRTSRDHFAGLNLTLQDPGTNLAELGAVVLDSRQRQEPIRDLRAVDQRDIAETDVLTDLDHRLDLDDLTARQFEHLVHELLAKMGLHPKHIRPSQDGVVDCIVFDARPILGGDIVVHAARHPPCLNLLAVQDLCRAVRDAGASKGILITTGGIDPSSHAYASGKPMELIDGAGLLDLISQHTGIRARPPRQDRQRKLSS